MPFIVLEGLDGSGKSTQLRLLTQTLENRNIPYEFLHFPRFDAPLFGELIARFLRGELGDLETVDPYLVAMIFAADRAEARPMVEGWLDEGKVVITDRYVYSNIAFQCAKLKDYDDKIKLMKWIMELEFIFNKLPVPDISLFLDVPYEFTRTRLEKQRSGDDREYLKGAQDIHEQSIDFQLEVRKMYLECASKDRRLHVVNCCDNENRMDTELNNFNKILSIVEPLITMDR